MPATTDAAAIEWHRQYKKKRGLLAGPRFIDSTACAGSKPADSVESRTDGGARRTDSG